MKKLLFIILLVPSICIGQKLGFKTGVLIYKTTPAGKFGTPKTIVSPLIGIGYQHSFNKFLIGIEPSFTRISTIEITQVTDIAGVKAVKQRSLSKSTYEIPIYIGYQILDKDFNLNVNAGLSVLDKSLSAFYGISGGYNIKRVSINANYKINGLISNQFINSYHALYLTFNYKF